MENLFQWTGHPFADSGLAAMLWHCEEQAPEELDATDAATMSALLLSVYLKGGWLKAMQNIFPNGALTNPAFSKNRAVPWGNALSFLTENLQPAQASGSCICCGSRDAVRVSTAQKKQFPNDMTWNKVYIPLVGGIPNFFPGGVMGADFCANCVLLIQCAPLSFYTANCDEKRFLVMHSNSPKVMKRWAGRALKSLDTQITLGEMTGPFNEGDKNAVNAFFDHTTTILGGLGQEDKFTSVSLYHFDNYNQPKSTPLKIYEMPTPVFRFLLEVANSPLKSNWKAVVARNYIFIKDGQIIPFTLEEGDERRKINRNLVFENLLSNRSIVSRFFSKRQRLVYAPWELLVLYLREVYLMEKSRLDTIKRVGDELADVIRTHNNSKKRLHQIERAKSYNDLCNVLIFCIKDRIEAKKEAPLFLTEEVQNDLFPEGALSWRETQNFLLFRLYENLHDWLKSKEGADALPIDETSEPELEPELTA